MYRKLLLHQYFVYKTLKQKMESDRLKVKKSFVFSYKTDKTYNFSVKHTYSNINLNKLDRLHNKFFITALL